MGMSPGAGEGHCGHQPQVQPFGCPSPPPLLSGNLQSLLPFVPLRFQFPMVTNGSQAEFNTHQRSSSVAAVHQGEVWDNSDGLEEAVAALKGQCHENFVLTETMGV